MNTNLNYRSGLAKARQSKRIMTLCALLLIFALSSFALPADKINSTVTNSFRKDFKDAQIISTEVSPAYTRLTFSMKDLVLSAFYSDDGELLAVTRNILPSQLPLDLAIAIKEKYKDFWVTGLFEMKSKEEHAWYLTLENANIKLALRSADNSTWELYRKTTKE